MIIAPLLFQRDATNEIFKTLNFYVFESDSEATDHIPEHALGCLGEMNKIEADRLREELLNRLKT